MPDTPAAFMTYVNLDDKHDNGRLTTIREDLSGAVSMRLGEKFTIFQDRNDNAWGQNWERRIDDALDGATLLLVIVTPGLFLSPPCQTEIKNFRKREEKLGRDDLI